MGAIIGGIEYCLPRDRQVGKVQRIFSHTAKDGFQYLGARGAERHDERRRRILFSHLGERKHAFAVKRLSAHETVRCDKIGGGQPSLGKGNQQFVGAVPHAPNDQRVCLRPEALPNVRDPLGGR